MTSAPEDDDALRATPDAQAPGEPRGAPPAGEPPTAPAGEPLSYEQASARIEEIVRRLDSGEAGLRETLDLVAEGRRLVEHCAAELDAVGKGLEELRLEELVARLERGGENGPADAAP
jgi:exodeoxyribonuclease VII small subunit